MAQSRVPLVIALILAAALGVALFLKHSSLEAARSEQAQLQTRLQAVAAELASCESERVGASRQIDSLKRDQEELVRLRGEVSQLRRTSAPSAAAPPVPAPKPAAASVVPDVEPKTLTASVKARIPANGVLVTGGWESSPGRRAIVLVSPIATTQPDGTVTVEITTRIVEGPEASLAAIGIDLRSGDTSTAQQLFDASQHATLLGALEAAEGLDLLSVPTITTADGRQAQVAWNADEHRRATEIGLIPKFDPTDGSVEVNVSASLAPWPAPAPVTPP